jgi:peptide/nickel transport system permease protein
MGAFIIRRILQMILVLLIISVIVFLMLRLLPGDPILMYLTQQDASTVTQEQVDKIRHDVGLDRPLYIQYFDWLGKTLRGDLGNSIIHRGRVMDDVKKRLPITLHLGLLAFMLSIIVGIPLGIITAVRRGKWIDNVLTSFGNMGNSLPNFWIGVLLIYLFGYKLDLLPIYGYTSPFIDFWKNLQEIIMPVFALSIPGIASGIRMTRSSMLEVLRQDYIRTAWAKGLSEKFVIIRHALKNGLIPVITMKGMTLRMIIGGSVFIETVFSIPGMGRLAVEGLFSQDYTVVQACLLILGTMTLIINFLIDLSYGWLDPRVRYS